MIICVDIKWKKLICSQVVESWVDKDQKMCKQGHKTVLKWIMFDFKSACSCQLKKFLLSSKSKRRKKNDTIYYLLVSSARVKLGGICIFGRMKGDKSIFANSQPVRCHKQKAIHFSNSYVSWRNLYTCKTLSCSNIRRISSSHTSTKIANTYYSPFIYLHFCKQLFFLLNCHLSYGFPFNFFPMKMKSNLKCQQICFFLCSENMQGSNIYNDD
jgi:hypothetical protein